MIERFNAQDCIEKADAERLVMWIRNPSRQRAVTAFTEGPERQVAYAVEDVINRLSGGAREERLQTLRNLKAAADKAIESAQANKRKLDGAINWGDLGCICAEHVVDQDGDESYRVAISEAAPENWRFHRFIRERLAEAGFPDVSVVTEW